MIEKSDLFQIKKDIETCIGEKVQLKANKGRKKAFIREGILENTYPSIFIVKFENEYEAELDDSLEEILASGNTGVILAIAQACRRLNAKQSHFYVVSEAKKCFLT